ncbi:MAG: methyl-accepting chemotaxis protein [Nitrospirota bacterium]|nr:methyl-accepting chemotaxis protein [Nitrospirota bacterium]
MRTNRRKQYFIDKSYQTRFILRFVIVTALWSAAALLLFAWIARQRIETEMYSSHLTIASSQELLLPSALYSEGIALLLYSVLLAYAIFDLGKRISAPLFMLKKDLARIGAGDLAIPVRLRPGDEFQDLAGEVDRMRAGLGSRFAEIKGAQQRLSRAVSELDLSMRQGLPLSEPIGEIRKAASAAQESLRPFTL